MPASTALVIGCTGLVGRELVQTLLAGDHYQAIKLVARQPLHLDDERIEEVVIDDFDHLGEHAHQLHAHDYYCALGTTIKKAGSRESFRKVDLDYPLALAEMAKNSPDFKQYLVVTAQGADTDSLFFYNRVKGELETKLRAMNLAALTIFRPTLLLGQRNEFRLGEKIGQAVLTFLEYFSVQRRQQRWSIEAADVARSMYLMAKGQAAGVNIMSVRDMKNQTLQ